MSNLISSISRINLKFKFEAGTSRGVLYDKDSIFLKLKNDMGLYGIGEVSPLKGLSPEFGQDLLSEIKTALESDLSLISENRSIPSSVKFGLETALKGIQNQHESLIFQNAFHTGELKIPINGLIWMGDFDLMKKRIDEKLSDSFKCIKLKIGAIDSREEFELLRMIRKRYSKESIQIRVDANGAYPPDRSQKILEELAELDIHSIEQPIMAGNWDAMAELCKKNALDIALDEELIGIRNVDRKMELLDTIKPQYIILKPTLHGGIFETQEWISLAEERDIKWWITSALESNIGLNAICQLCAQYDIKLYQGLGTGQLYENNIPSPLEVRSGFIYTNSNKWDFSELEFKPL